MKNVAVSKRIKAYIVDWLFIIILMIGLLFILGTPLIIIMEISNSKYLNFDIMYFSFLIFSVYIYPIFKDLIFPCGSIGYKIAKIKIVDQKTGLRPTTKQLILRGLFFMLVPIDIAFAAKRLDNLSLFDIATNTKVIYQSENSDTDVHQI